MSFFKKLTDDFDGLGLGSKRDDGDRYSGNRDYPPPQPRYGDGPSHHYQHQDAAYPSSYDHQPPSGYASRDGPRDYGAPPPSGDYGAPPPSQQPPSYNPPADKPRIPDGWVPQWDGHYERWYYVDQATGRAQWEAPGYDAQLESRGYDSHGGGGGYGGGSHENWSGGQVYGGGGGHGGYDGGYGGEEKKKSSSSGMLLGVAGGLAAGAVGGALLHEALDDSDDEHRAAAPVYAPSYDNPQPPGVLPATDAYGDEVSSSDRESVQEAREDYEEALAAAQDSDASSSEQEELEEAREEYEEEYEEAYYDD